MRKENAGLEHVASWRDAISACWPTMLVCVMLAMLVGSALAYRNVSRGLDGDQGLYYSLANNILDGRGYTDANMPCAEKSPGYSAFLSIVFAATNRSLFAARLIQAFIYALACGLLVLFAFKISGNRTVALLSGLAAALNAVVISQATLVLSDGLFGVLAFTFIVALDDALRTDRRWMLVAAAVVFGLCVYVRPTLFVFPAAIFAIAWHLGVPWRKCLSKLLLLFVVTFVLLLPWSIRNYRVFGVFSPLPAESGYVLYWNWDRSHIPNTNFRYIAKNVPGVGTKIAYDRDKALMRYAISQIKAHPDRYAKTSLKKAIGVWTTIHWLTPGHRASKLFGVFRLGLLLVAIGGLTSKRLDSLFRGYVTFGMLYVTTVVTFISSDEYRFTFWLMPFLYILCADFIYSHYVRCRAVSATEPIRRE